MQGLAHLRGLVGEHVLQLLLLLAQHLDLAFGIEDVFLDLAGDGLQLG